jgi:hypothetical protein
LRRGAQKKGQVVTAERLALCHWTVHLTNLPPELANASEVETWRRSRWQIELLFKLWKSNGGLERSRSADPDRVRCEVLGKMLAMVVQHWVLWASCWEEPAQNLRKAARSVRDGATSLAAALQKGLRAWIEVLELVRLGVARVAKVSRRQDRPPTYARLQDPALSGYTLT